MKGQFFVSAEEFKGRRNALYGMMPPNSVAVVCPSLHVPSSADALFPYRQNPNLFYLTGVPFPDTYLIMYPDHPDPDMQEILLVKYPDEKTLIWDMSLPSLEEYSKISGIKNVQYSTNLFVILNSVVPRASYLFLEFNEHTRATREIPTPSEILASKISQKFPFMEVKRLTPLISKLRVSKSEAEIQLIQKAVSIASSAYAALIKELPNLASEREVEGYLYYQCLRNGADGFAFPPIIASDINSTILHYSLNNQPLNDKTLLLIDFGASFTYYNSDITRCLFLKEPTKRHIQVYKAVKEIHDVVISHIRQGISLWELNAIARKHCGEKLFELQLISRDEKNDSYILNKKINQYFPHKVGHYLGIDVHDVGDLYEPLPYHAVITCEPGIYIREEKIGIRLESDVLVENSTPIILSSDIPFLNFD